MQRQIPLSALHLADEGPMHARLLRELLLGEAPFVAKFAHSPTELGGGS